MKSKCSEMACQWVFYKRRYQWWKWFFGMETSGQLKSLSISSLFRITCIQPSRVAKMIPEQRELYKDTLNTAKIIAINDIAQKLIIPYFLECLLWDLDKGWFLWIIGAYFLIKRKQKKIIIKASIGKRNHKVLRNIPLMPSRVLNSRQRKWLLQW